MRKLPQVDRVSGVERTLGAGALLRWLLLLCAGGLAACSDGRTVVVVSVSGITTGIKTLRATATLNGMPAQPEDFDAPGDGSTSARFGLRLPSGAQGPYVLTVDGRSSQTCSASRGQGSATINGEPRDDLNIALLPLPYMDCGGPTVPITITRAGSGGGTVSSTPAVIDCGATCSANIPQGASITLTATANNTSRFLGWSGACTGSGPSCSTTVSTAAQVTANFGPLVCSPGNFCWENPFPRGYNILRLFGLGSRDIWASGDDGSLLHYDGQSWTPTASGTTMPLFTIWGAKTDDVWTVGGALLRWNGTAWSTVTVPVAPAAYFLGVWGNAANDVWFVGRNGTIVHWDGTQFTAPASGTTNTLTSVWGFATNNVWAVGNMGTIVHWDGTKWSTVTSPSTSYLTWVWGISATDLWATGAAGTILHYTGTWQSVASGVTATLNGVWGASASDVWFAGDDNGFANTILHWNGSALAPPTVPIGRIVNLNCVWGTFGNDVYFGSYGTILHFDGVGWSPSVNSGTTNLMYSVWGRNAQDVWAVGGNGTALHWDGASWAQNFQTGITATINDIWGSAANDVWAAADAGTLLHWDGSSWTSQSAASGAYLGGIWGSSSSDIWAVGGNGASVHYNGKMWTSVSTGTTNSLTRVWGSRTDDVWAVGVSGTIASRRRAIASV